jgi:hypothetical protein
MLSGRDGTEAAWFCEGCEEKVGTVINNQNFNIKKFKMLTCNKWKIRFPRRFRALFFVLLFGITLLFSSCGAIKDSQTKDIEALQAVYQDSNWEFRQSSTDVQVYDKGTVRISIRGKAIERTPGRDKFAWIPVALVKKLPEYYAIEGNKYPEADLNAYQVKGGLWHIIALVPVASQNVSEGIEGTQTHQVDFNVLMISPAFDESNFLSFAKSLPLYLPVGQGLVSVETSIVLPQKAKFISHSIKGKKKSDPVKLIEFPSSLSKNKVTARTTLDPKSSILWDLSSIKYKFPEQILSQGFKFLPILLIVCGIIETLFLYFLMQKRREKERIWDYLRLRIEDLIYQIKEIDFSQKSDRERKEDMKSKFENALTKILSDIDISDKRGKVPLVQKFAGEVERIKNKFENQNNDNGQNTGTKEKINEKIKEELLFLLEEWLLRAKRTAKIPAKYVFRFSLYGVIILAFLILFLLPSVALSQNQKTINPEDFCFEKVIDGSLFMSKNLCLENFDLEISFPDPEINNGKSDIALNKSYISLDLLPISTRLNPAKEKIVIRFNDIKSSRSSKIRICEGKVTCTGKASVEPESIDHQSKLDKSELTKLPIKEALPPILRPGGLAGSSSELDKSIAPFSTNQAKTKIKRDAYNRFKEESLETIRTEYPLKNILEPIENIKIKNFQFFGLKRISERTIALFPFDGHLFKLPITVDKAHYILSYFKFNEPKNYGDTTVNFDGIDARILPSDEGFHTIEKPSKPITPDTTWHTYASIVRPDAVSLGKLVWAIPLGFLAGVILGFGNGEKLAIPVRLNNLLPQIFARGSALVGLITGTYFFILESTYKAHPDIEFFGNGGEFPTIFELFIVAAIIVLLLTTIASYILFIFIPSFSPPAAPPPSIDEALIRFILAIIFGIILAVLAGLRQHFPVPIASFLGSIGIISILIASFSNFTIQVKCYWLILGLFLIILIPIYGFIHLPILENLTAVDKESLSTFFGILKINFYHE